MDATLLAAPDWKSPSAPLVHGEHFEVCHQIRDGHPFEHPGATRKADIVIVGGGLAGLSAAYFLRGKDWLLLEKEPQFGGNARQEEFEGQVYGTGSAYAYRDDQGDQLASRPPDASGQLARSHHRQPHVGPRHLENRHRSTSLSERSARKLQEIS
ncbi:MAG: hypothetical protein DMG51_03820 [Acidobacteria bacterium]|nr:MAG: hypothetical protein DMG51_03820 [Acidobacteriota bacterium]